MPVRFFVAVGVASGLMLLLMWAVSQLVPSGTERGLFNVGASLASIVSFVAFERYLRRHVHGGWLNRTIGPTNRLRRDVLFYLIVILWSVPIALTSTNLVIRVLAITLISWEMYLLISTIRRIRLSGH